MTSLFFWKWLEKEDEDTGETVKIPFLRYYRVFEINSQVEGLKSKRDVVECDHDPIEEAQKNFKSYPESPTYTYKSGRAYYQPALDKINVPPLKDYKITLYQERQGSQPIMPSTKCKAI